MTECRHGLSEDCPACMQATIDALAKALVAISKQVYTDGGPTRAARIALDALDAVGEAK